MPLFDQKSQRKIYCNFLIILEEHNIQTRLLFSGNLIKHPCFDEFRDTDTYSVVGTLENTEYIMNNSFWIGVYPGMTDDMIEYMSEVIVEAISR